MFFLIAPFFLLYLRLGYDYIATSSLKASDFATKSVSFELYAFGVVIYALAFFAAMIMFWLVYPKLQPFAEWLHRGFSGKVMRVLQVISAVLGVPALILFLIFA